MRASAGTIDRGGLIPVAVLIGALGLLAVEVLRNSQVSLVAPLVLMVAVGASSHRSLFKWESLLAGVVLVIFFIPIKRYTLPSALPFNLEPYRLLIMFLAVAWVTSMLIDPRVRLRKSGLEPPILLFAFAALASVAFNDSSIAAAGVTTLVVKTLTFFASFFILFYAVVGLVRTRSHLDRLVSVLVGSGALVAFSAVIESRTDFNIFNHLGQAFPLISYHDPNAIGLSFDSLNRGGRLRVYASAEHPIELSAVLVMLIPLAFYLAKSSGHRRWFFMAGVLALGAFATVSRTGVVMMVVVGLVLLRLKAADVKRFSPLLVPALCVLYFALPHTLGSFYSAFFPKGGLIADQSTVTTDNNQAYADGRLADIGPSVREWEQKPLFGEGFGSRVVSNQDAETLGVKQSRLLDDQWLGSLLETGFVGICALLWLFIRPIRRMFRIAKEDDGEDGWLAAALAASLFGFAFGMLTFDALGFVQVTILFFLLLAFSSVLRHLYDERQTGRPLAEQPA